MFSVYLLHTHKLGFMIINNVKESFVTFLIPYPLAMFIIDKKQSCKLTNISFVCTLLVVFIHCSGNGVDLISLFLRQYIPGAFLPMAVPVFFTISGFLLAGHYGTGGWYSNALRRRLRTLLIPYCILNIIYWHLKWFVHTVAMKHFG